MASLAAAGRLSARLAGRSWMRSSRGFRTSARYAVAHNFTMPALSPTMTEGNIATWQVKEGDKFSAGDVLLEIETDKASMDVEAQEDGQVFKILQPNGTKGIPVGARIGVMAEADDDLASLTVPPDEAVAAKAPAASAPAAAAPTPAASASASSSTSTSTPKTPSPPQKYPLLPSVAHLIKEHGLDADTVASQATPTGPNGRLLKGDVLAFLGQVPADLPAALAAQIDSHAHLDLSNIRLRQVEEPKKEEKKEEVKAKVEEVKEVKIPSTLVSLPVSLSAVLDAQDKIQASLGVFMPVSTFVARATDVANDALPRAGPPPPPSAAQLFDELLGAPAKAPSTLSRGHYRPQVSALPLTKRTTPKTPAIDVIDILTGRATAPRRAAPPPPPAVSTSANFFSLDVPATEEQRAKVFLERLKVVLENEPGRLVL